MAPFIQRKIFKSPIRRRIAQSAFFVGISGAALSIWAAAAEYDALKVPIAVFWTLGPPVYFVVEYCFLFDNWDDEVAVEDMKQAQTLFFQFWAGVAVLLGVLYYDR